MVGMKHGSNPRRGRSRGGNGGKRHQPSRNQAFDSNGPEGKVRGSAQQIYDKYLSLARDASSAGEHIAAEGFYQFAEHYYRVANADGAMVQRLQQGNQDPNSQTDDDQPEDAVQPGAGDRGDVAKPDDAGTGEQSKRRRAPRKAQADSETDSLNRSAPAMSASDDAGDTPVVPPKSDTNDGQASTDEGDVGKDDLAASA